MSILTTNIRNLCWRRELWWFYLMIGGVVPGICSGIQVSVFQILTCFYAGFVAGNMQKELASKPFVFCLPGHREMFRNFVFWIGGVLNSILGCFFLFLEVEFPDVILVMLGGVFIGMAYYLGGVLLSILDHKRPAVMIPLVFVFGLLVLSIETLSKGLQSLLVSQPGIFILTGTAISIWAWRQLGRVYLARTYCGRRDVGFFDDWNRKKTEAIRQSRILLNLTPNKERTLERFQALFLGRMERYAFLGTGRTVWGTLYAVVGRYFWPQPIGFMICLLTLMAMAFSGIGNPGVYLLHIMVFIILVVWIGTMDLRPVRSMLLPAGRREVFRATLIVSALIALAGAGILAVWIALSVVLQHYMPAFTIHGNRIVFHAFPLWIFYFYLLLMPLALYDAVRAERDRSGSCTIILFFLFAVIDDIAETFILKSMIETLGPLCIAGFIGFSWASFVLALRHLCMKRSLVHPGR